MRMLNEHNLTIVPDNFPKLHPIEFEGAAVVSEENPRREHKI